MEYEDSWNGELASDEDADESDVESYEGDSSG